MKKVLLVIVGTLLCSLLLCGIVLAMSSANYRLDWFTPLTGSGGGSTASANYATSFTVGQSAIGAASGAGYDACLGYWCGQYAGAGPGIQYRVYLPVTVRGYQY
jgi:hypothetical protein